MGELATGVAALTFGPSGRWLRAHSCMRRYQKRAITDAAAAVSRVWSHLHSEGPRRVGPDGGTGGFAPPGSRREVEGSETKTTSTRSTSGVSTVRPQLAPAQ